jgi:NAD(P)-dependent dehydrogenase (short-subunit alcohol dehydrogenase family)
MVIIVSGGTFGIGRAISLKLARDGHTVIAFGLETRQVSSVAENGAETLRAEAAAIGLHIDTLEADVSDAAGVARVVDFALTTYGSIGGLVNNAAIGPLGTILTTSEELWQRVLDVNLKGAYLASKAVLPHMIERGSGVIANVGSGGGWGKPNMLAYAASKGGMFALAAALAYDHAADGIRVNTVVPRPATLTGMSLGRLGGDIERYKPAVAAVGRVATADDCANAVAFLFTPGAGGLNGAIVDAGSLPRQGGPLVPPPAP